MMKKLDPEGTGKIDGKAFKEANAPKADDIAAKIREKYGSAGAAFKEWDKDGDGKVNEDEFAAGAQGLGFPPEVSKGIWKAKDKDGDGLMDPAAFSTAFGMGPDELMELLFQHYGNPVKAFDVMDENDDGLLDDFEWKIGAAKLKLKPDQIDRIFKAMDTNHKEKTGAHISKWEFYDYLDYQPPTTISRGDGYGDIDPFGTDHKKFNELPVDKATGTQPAAQPATSSAGGTQPAAQPAFPPPTSAGTSAETSADPTSGQYTVDHCSSCDIYDLLQLGDPIPATGVKLVNCCGKIFNATVAVPNRGETSENGAQKLEEEVSKAPTPEAEDKTLKIVDFSEPRHHFYHKIEETVPEATPGHFLPKKQKKHVKKEAPHHRHRIQA
jgi:hypothetical protein